MFYTWIITFKRRFTNIIIVLIAQSKFHFRSLGDAKYIIYYN